MGCLKSLINKIIFIVLVVAFFVFGGYSFLVKKNNEYQNPPRAEFVKLEADYGNFINVPSDYQLSRSFNLFGYKKITAKYLPTGQKITIFNLKDEKLINENDFKTKKIDTKIDMLLQKTKDSFITLENFKIVQKGTYNAKGKQVPYIKFQADVKNVPFKKVSGIIGAYSLKIKNKNNNYLILSTNDPKTFDEKVVSSFIKAIKF